MEVNHLTGVDLDTLTPAQQVNAMIAQNNAWSAQQAQKQMDFQREMSNTAHQREIADLKAAGLNPVLSAKLGGASTPSGAMASGDTSGTSALVDLLMMSMQAANSAAGAAYAVASGSNGIDNPLARYQYKNPRTFEQMIWNFMIDQFGQGMYDAQNGVPFLQSLFGDVRNVAAAIGFNFDEFMRRFQKKAGGIFTGVNSSAASAVRGQGILKGSGSGLWGHTTGEF